MTKQTKKQNDTNLVMMVGRLGDHAESKPVNEKTTVANFSIASNRVFINKKRERKEITDWHDCRLWNRDNLVPYLTKGTQILVVGTLVNNLWEDKHGQKRKDEIIEVKSIQLLDFKKADGQDHPGDDFPYDDIPF